MILWVMYHDSIRRKEILIASDCMELHTHLQKICLRFLSANQLLRLPCCAAAGCRFWHNLCHHRSIQSMMSIQGWIMLTKNHKPTSEFAIRMICQLFFYCHSCKCIPRLRAAKKQVAHIQAMYPCRDRDIWGYSICRSVYIYIYNTTLYSYYIYIYTYYIINIYIYVYIYIYMD